MDIGAPCPALALDVTACAAADGGIELFAMEDGGQVHHTRFGSREDNPGWRELGTYPAEC
jgi:hypothetical protein